MLFSFDGVSAIYLFNTLFWKILYYRCTPIWITTNLNKPNPETIPFNVALNLLDQSCFEVWHFVLFKYSEIYVFIPVPYLRKGFEIWPHIIKVYDGNTPSYRINYMLLYFLYGYLFAMRLEIMLIRVELEMFSLATILVLSWIQFVNLNIKDLNDFNNFTIIDGELYTGFSHFYLINLILEMLQLLYSYLLNIFYTIYIYQS